MKIKLARHFAPNSAADSFDVLQIKKAMNRMGYYIPLPTTGITDIPDAAIANIDSDASLKQTSYCNSLKNSKEAEGFTTKNK
jgi:hypothetical protein